MNTPGTDKQRWVVNNVDPLTIDVIKTLATSNKQSMGHTLDQVVEYFSRKIVISTDKPFTWQLPDDF
jgi:hypothetical protein